MRKNGMEGFRTKTRRVIGRCSMNHHKRKGLLACGKETPDFRVSFSRGTNLRAVSRDIPLRCSRLPANAFLCSAGLSVRVPFKLAGSWKCLRLAAVPQDQSRQRLGVGFTICGGGGGRELLLRARKKENLHNLGGKPEVPSLGPASFRNLRGQRQRRVRRDLDNFFLLHGRVWTSRPVSPVMFSYSANYAWPSSLRCL